MGWLDALLARGNEAKRLAEQPTVNNFTVGDQARREATAEHSAVDGSRIGRAQIPNCRLFPMTTDHAAWPASPVHQPKSKPEIKSFWFQTGSPGNDDLGMVAACFYSVADGVLTIHDEDGRPGKSQALQAGDDERQIAARLAKAVLSAGRSDFNRPLGYARSGYA